MDWFDAVGHAFSTVAIGGFSTHDQSIGHFQSTAIELIAVVFMLLAGMIFLVTIVRSFFSPERTPGSASMGLSLTGSERDLVSQTFRSVSKCFRRGWPVLPGPPNCG